jgi:SAM-dependent methyltransferase
VPVRAQADAAPQGWEACACALCGPAASERLLPIPQQDDSGQSWLVRCAGCGLRRIDPRPSPALLPRYYDTGYSAFAGRRRSPRKQRAWDLLRDAYARPAAPHERAAWLAPLRPVARWALDINVALDGRRGLRILDVGCGFGDLLAYLRSRGCVVQGVDPDPRAADAAAAYDVPVHVGSLESLRAPAGSFDVAVLCHSLEHVMDPEPLLREVHRLLRPGGRLHVAVPNGGAAGLAIEGVDWMHFSHPLHLWFFDVFALGRLLARCGFAPCEGPSTTSRWHPLGTWRNGVRTAGFRAATGRLLRIARHRLSMSRSGDVLRVVGVRLP